MIISLLLILISSLAKSVSDAIAHGKDSVFPNNNWWDASESWKNKYKDRDPEKGPAFPLSTTLLVFVTDAWHFFNMIGSTAYCMIPAVLLTNDLKEFLLIFAGCRMIYMGAFHFVYHEIFEKHGKENNEEKGYKKNN